MRRGYAVVSTVAAGRRVRRPPDRRPGRGGGGGIGLWPALRRRRHARTRAARTAAAEARQPARAGDHRLRRLRQLRRGPTATTPSRPDARGARPGRRRPRLRGRFGVDAPPAPPSARGRAGPGGEPAPGGCDPSYPTLCLPVGSPDINCPEVGRGELHRLRPTRTASTATRRHRLRELAPTQDAMEWRDHSCKPPHVLAVS